MAEPNATATGFSFVPASLDNGPHTVAVHVADIRGAVGVEPFEFIPEFPPTGADARALDDDELDQLVMPTFDRIGHDASWRSRVRSMAPDYSAVLRGAMSRF